MEKERGITIINKDKGTVNGVLDSVIWRCVKRMYDTSGRECFTVGKLYRQVKMDEYDFALKDNFGDISNLPYEKDYFTSI